MTLDFYARAFGDLHRNRGRDQWDDRTRGGAPHKPLLLLAVIDLFASGLIQNRLVELSPDLIEFFALYWGRVFQQGQPGKIGLPFFHLSYECFWHLVPCPGQEEALKAATSISTVRRLQTLTLGAEIHPDLSALLKQEEARERLRRVLIETNFAPEIQAGLYEQGAINSAAFLYSAGLLNQIPLPMAAEPTPADSYLVRKVRDQGFQRAVTIAYDRRCALCGIRVVMPEAHSVVDAYHIRPGERSQDDRPANGLALCRVCHWSFDEGLTSVSRNYTILTSPQLLAPPNIAGYLGTLQGREIIKPSDEAFWPDPDSLDWRRKHVFRAK